MWHKFSMKKRAAEIWGGGKQLKVGRKTRKVPHPTAHTPAERGTSTITASGSQRTSFGGG